MKLSGDNGFTVMVTGLVLARTGLEESAAMMPTVVEPVTAGVPVSEQFDPSVRPLGSVPEFKVQVYGAVPPVTGMVPTYGVLTVAAAGDPTASVAVGAFTVTETVAAVLLVGLLESVA